MMYACGENQQYDTVNTDDKPIHQFPIAKISKPCRKHIAGVYSRKYHEMEQRKENGHVALRRHPQLNVRHALKCALYLGYAFDEADEPEQWQPCDIADEPVGDNHHNRGSSEQGFVGESKLHPEQHGKPYRHSCQIAIQAHQHILAHVGCGTYNLVEGT